MQMLHASLVGCLLQFVACLEVDDVEVAVCVPRTSNTLMYTGITSHLSHKRGKRSTHFTWEPWKYKRRRELLRGSLDGDTVPLTPILPYPTIQHKDARGTWPVFH